MIVPSYVAAPLGLVPRALIEALVGRIFAQLMRVHPGLFERLGDYAGKKFAFLPVDLPIGFVVEPDKAKIAVVSRAGMNVADATISGPLVTLLALLEGRLDGDALFFSRDISIAGDMEAVLALRNALDDSLIDLPKDLGKATGPLAPIVQKIASAIRDRALAAS